MILRTARGEQRTVAPEFNPSGQIIVPYGLGAFTGAGVIVDQQTAYGLPAVNSVIRQPASLIATLPFKTYRNGPEGVPVEALDAWQFDLLNEAPNEETDSYQFFYDVALSIEASQNCFIHKIKSGSKIEALRVLDPQAMRVTRDQSTGPLTYKYYNNGKETPIPADQVLHIRGFTPCPGNPVGVSLIHVLRDALGAQAAAQNFVGDYYRNNAQAPLYFTGHANQQQAQDNRDLWNAQHQGSGAQHKPGFLWGNIDVKTVPLSMADAAYAETKRLSTEDACRIWHWPVHLMEISGDPPLRNEDMWTALFMKIYVMPRLRRIEKAFAADPDLFAGQELFGQFVVDEIERSDASVRAVAYKDFIQGGVYTPNEARALEKLPPKDGGDDIQFPLVGGGAIQKNQQTDGQNGNGAARSLADLLNP